VIRGLRSVELNVSVQIETSMKPDIVDGVAVVLRCCCGIVAVQLLCCGNGSVGLRWCSSSAAAAAAAIILGLRPDHCVMYCVVLLTVDPLRCCSPFTIYLRRRDQWRVQECKRARDQHSNI
jgi:hypothetical protein